MKTILTILFLSLLNLNLVSANTTNMITDNFFIGPEKGKAIITVKSLLETKVKDDIYVSLEGNIIERISKEKFLFQDATGKILIEIEDDILRELNNAKITPQNVIKITGEVDKDFAEKIKIEVSVLNIIK